MGHGSVLKVLSQSPSPVLERELKWKITIADCLRRSLLTRGELPEQ